jgi:hypothetical protein
MSREDVFEAMLHWKLLRDAGVKIVTCQRGELDFSNLGGVITAIVDQYGAREESIKLAQRVASGQRLKAKQGQRIGGIVFGYDREMYDDAAKLVRRVSFRERFRKPPTWRSKLVPSDDHEAVAAVQWAFDAICQGHSIGYVIRGLNGRGLTTMFGKPFIHSTVVSMLKNPAYAGVLRVGTYSRGKFCSVAEDGLIVVENAHEPLVSLETFERVQQIVSFPQTCAWQKNRRGGGERPVTGDSGACGGTRGTTGRGGCGRGHRAGRLADGLRRRGAWAGERSASSGAESRGRRSAAVGGLEVQVDEVDGRSGGERGGVTSRRRRVGLA